MHATWALPLVSFLVAAAAVLIFLLRAPFPIWWKALFVVSVLPAYEYSVMARNYGISMLLMFAFASVYTGKRYRPIALGVVLLLLANTNVHSAILVGAYLVMWLYERLARRAANVTGLYERIGGATLLAMGIAALGIVACFATIYPTYNDLIGHGVRNGNPLWLAAKSFILPGEMFGDLLLEVTNRPAIIIDSLILFALALGLLVEPILCAVALGAVWTFALFFSEVYTGALRHEGLLFVFLISLYWIAAARRAPRPAGAGAPYPVHARLFTLALSVMLPLVLALMSVRSAQTIIHDLRYPVTESAAAGRLIRDDRRLKDAIVIAEPDYVGMALRYYVPNTQYLVRERRFGDSVRFARSSVLDLSLADLLACARRLQQTTGKPVVILLAHELVDAPQEQVTRFSYAWSFRYSAQELAQFRASTEHLATLRDAPGSSENYDVYLLKADAPSSGG